MTDYNLGRAHGKIEIDFDDTGSEKAIVDLDKATAASDDLDKSLTKTNRTLGDTSSQMGQSGSAADGYKRRLQDVRKASQEVDEAEKAYKATLLDEKATLSDVESAHDRVSAAKRKHIQATNAERDANKALGTQLGSGERAYRALGDVITHFGRTLERLATTQTNVANKNNVAAKSFGLLGKAVALVAPEATTAAEALELMAKGSDKVGSSASRSSGMVTGFIKDIAGFEAAIGKISGMSLGIPALGGLAGIGGASAVQGIVEVLDSLRQLSGALGLLPAMIGGAGVVMGTLKVALHGVGDALKDMMADDPKKFLEDLKNMGPAAARSMLQIAQFRDQFKLGGAAVQDSFFTKIAADIAPLIQTWLPALVSAGSKIAGVLGGMADQFAHILLQPATMSAFTTFIQNVATGLQALQPAMAPLVNVFTQLSVVGSSFFGQLGGVISEVAQRFSTFINQAAASGALQQWIQTGINAFEHLGNIVLHVGEFFNTVMSVADKFGGGGLLGFLDKLTAQLNNWSNSQQGQQALEDFFGVLRIATDAFLPILKPLTDGLLSIGQAFVTLGTATAPAWLEFFKTFAYEMANDLGPAIAGMGPAVATFLHGLSDAFRQLTQTLAPQLPTIFQELANAFVALLPQIPQLAVVFIQLAEGVGPQLPTLFKAVTDAINDLLPYLPDIIGFIRDFVSAITILVNVGSDVIDFFVKFEEGLAGFIEKIPGWLGGLGDKIGGFFSDLPNKALGWGKSIIKGLIDGMLDSTGLTGLGNAANSVVDKIAQWFQSSPAKVGPFSGSGYTMVRGQKMVQDMATGMVSARGAVTAAAHSTAAAASGALNAGAGGSGGTSGGGGGGAAPGAGGAGTEGGGGILPDWIANASNAPLNAYLKHQFPDNRGLKGLAKSLGDFLKVTQDGFNLIDQHAIQPMSQAMNMIPALKQQPWTKLSPQEFARQQTEELQRKAMQGGQQGPTWGQVLGGDAGAGATGDQQLPLGATASSSKQDIQKAIIAAGRSRGLNDAAIQTALAVASDESGFNPTISGGVQGSAGWVSGLYQQSPSSGWGTPDQVNDPTHAINAFYNAFAAQLAKNPTDPMLAAVLTQNPQLAQAPGGPKGSKYWSAVTAQLGTAGQILSQLGPGVKGPDWPAITSGAPSVPTGGLAPGAAPAPITALPLGTRIGHDGSLSFPSNAPIPPGLDGIKLPPGTRIGHDGSLSFPAGAAIPPQFAGAPGISGAGAGAAAGPGGVGLNPASQASRVPIAPNVEAGIRSVGGLGSTLYPTSGPGAYQVPAWANQLAGAFGLTASTYANGGSLHQMGYAFDFNDPNSPNGSSPKLDAFANFISKYLAPQTLQLIHASGNQRWGIASGQDVSSGGYYAGDYGGHFDHVHFATDVPVLINGQVPPGSLVSAGAAAGTGAAGSATGLGGSLQLSNGQTIDQLLDSSKKNVSVNDQMLQAYLAGNPALAAQIDAAKTPGAPDSVVQSTLGNISSTITSLKTQDAIGNKNSIDALQATQSQIAQSSGFVQGQSPASMFGNIASGASTIATSVIQAIQGGLDSLTATQDIADRLVYGIRNTQDVGKIIDDVQKYITEAANIASATGSILSTIGGLVGAAGSADPSGGSAGASAALNSAGQIAQLIAGVLQGINAAIDFGQEVAQITGGYVGRFLSFLTGPTQMMGDVRFLLNKNTGKLLTYSEDNPLNKNTQNVPSFFSGLYGYGTQNPNPQVQQNLTVFAGPGQSPSDMMNETAWMVNTQGPATGALQEANF